MEATGLMLPPFMLMTNGRFLSVQHRVLASNAGPRVSVPCFFMAGTEPELLSEGDTPRYKEVTIAEYYREYRNNGLDGTPNLDYFKIEDEECYALSTPSPKFYPIVDHRQAVAMRPCQNVAIPPNAYLPPYEI
ncbi:hypothetical protein EJ110_NYTH45290 [Nymphaea thermarum]|nr:hypothetical protein EJ110_NYTH45290 [Nymphaea thermarum]